MSQQGGIRNWALSYPQQQLVKTNGRLIEHARCDWVFLAVGHLSRGCLELCCVRLRYHPASSAGEQPTRSDFERQAESRRKGIEGISRERKFRVSASSEVMGDDTIGPFRLRWELRPPKTRLAIASRSGHGHVANWLEVQIGNLGVNSLLGRRSC